MMRVAALAAVALLAGCELRNDPEQQAADFKVCKEAGMDAYLTIDAVVKCMPPRQTAAAKAKGGDV